TTPQSLNRYAYVMNNPTSFIDPLGLDVCPPQAQQAGICSVSGGVVTWYPPGGAVVVPPSVSFDPFNFLFSWDCSGDDCTTYINGDLVLALSSRLGLNGSSTSPAPSGQTTDRCSKIAGKGGVISTRDGTRRFEFNAQGNLIG